MTFKFFDRFFAAVAGLIMLFLGACLFILGFGIFPFSLNQTIQSFLLGDFVLWQRFVMLGVALVFCALGIHSLSLLFRRRKDKGFIMQHTEYGDMSISMQAMENMVKKCVDTHEELKVTHTRIHRNKESVVVNLRIALANGVNIPLTVNALQKQIKHYITSCSGVDVKEVRVMVDPGNHSPKSAEVITPDLAAADAYMNAQNSQFRESFMDIGQQPGAASGGEASGGKEPIHQRIFKHEEMPNVFPEPPAESPEGAPLGQSEKDAVEEPEKEVQASAQAFSDAQEADQSDISRDESVKENE